MAEGPGKGLNFFVKITLIGLVLVGAAVLLMIVLSPGEKAQIQTMLKDGEAAINRHDADACVAFIWPSYNHENIDYMGICARIREYVTGSFTKVELLDAEIDVVGDLATVNLKLKPTGGSMPVPVRLHFSLRRMNGRWWIDGIDAPDNR